MAKFFESFPYIGKRQLIVRYKTIFIYALLSFLFILILFFSSFDLFFFYGKISGFLLMFSSGYLDFNKYALYSTNVSLNMLSSSTLSEQFVRHLCTTVVGMFSAL